MHRECHSYIIKKTARKKTFDAHNAAEVKQLCAFLAFIIFAIRHLRAMVRHALAPMKIIQGARDAAS